MTPTDLRPADATVHTPDHNDHCDEAVSATECASEWLARRRRNQTIRPARLPQPVRW
ncbi:MAG: hypothetical protein AAGH74_13405 [Pseudomonadota bacterium]